MKHSTKKLCRVLLALVISAAFFAAQAPAAEKLNIVCTTTDLASIAGSVAGSLAQVTSITTGKEDPHFIQAKPSYMVRARSADLWVRLGMEMEVGWEPPLIDGSRNPRIRPGASGHLDASEKVLRMDVPATRVTRAMGDVHPQGNPHYWLDPINGRIAAEEIAGRLCVLDPVHADQYRQNLEAFQRKLDTAMFGPALVRRFGGARLWAWQVKGELAARLEKQNAAKDAGGWWAVMRPFQGQGLITYHKSWGYFCRRFGLRVLGELEPKPGVPPSGAHLQKILAIMKARQVRLILQEPFYPQKAAGMLAAQAGAKVLVITNSVGGGPGAPDYISLLNLIVVRTKAALH